MKAIRPTDCSPTSMGIAKARAIATSDKGSDRKDSNAGDGDLMAIASASMMETSLGAAKFLCSVAFLPLGPR